MQRFANRVHRFNSGSGLHSFSQRPTEDRQISSLMLVNPPFIPAAIVRPAVLPADMGDARMKLLISPSALLLSIILVQMGIGALRPFDTISGQALGFTP